MLYNYTHFEFFVTCELFLLKFNTIITYNKTYNNYLKQEFYNDSYYSKILTGIFTKIKSIIGQF